MSIGSEMETGRATTIYIGIDDTDNLESRGTGFHARQLASEIMNAGLGVVLGVTRHQLFVCPEIPYTSHNSAACLAILTPEETSTRHLIPLCRNLLECESAPGSDAGFCVVPQSGVTPEIHEFGWQAKRKVLTADEAQNLTLSCRGCHLEGVTGDHGGVIGALAAVGLRSGGQDGRFIWVKGLREKAGMALSARDLLALTGVDRVQACDGSVVDDTEAVVLLGEWPRPILQFNQAVLLVEECNDKSIAAWQVVPKDHIKQY